MPLDIRQGSTAIDHDDGPGGEAGLWGSDARDDCGHVLSTSEARSWCCLPLRTY
jgi:hypothetical protein